MWRTTRVNSRTFPILNLCLIYVNELSKSSKLLNPVMFADDTNLFVRDNNITTLFAMANNELKHVNVFCFFSIWLDVPHLTNEHRTQDCIAS